MAITDRRLMGPDPIGYAASCIERIGARLILQIREKDLSAADLCEWIERLLPVAGRHGALLLINGRVDIARAYGVGVHLPENGLDVASARSLMPATGWISASRHDLEGAVEAVASGATAVTLSPVFDGAKGRGMGLAALAQAALDPRLERRVFALGGVDATNAGAVWAAGVCGIAAIRAVWCGDPEALNS